MTDTCPEQIDVRGHKCARPIEDEGLCKMHLRHKREREEKRQRHAQERLEQEQRYAEAEAKCVELRKLGIAATPHIGSLTERYTGKVVVDADIVLSLVKP